MGRPDQADPDPPALSLFLAAALLLVGLAFLVRSRAARRAPGLDGRRLPMRTYLTAVGLAGAGAALLAWALETYVRPESASERARFIPSALAAVAALAFLGVVAGFRPAPWVHQRVARYVRQRVDLVRSLPLPVRAVAGAGAYAVVLWVALDGYQQPETPDDRARLVRELALALAVTALVVGVYLVALRERVRALFATLRYRQPALGVAILSVLATVCLGYALWRFLNWYVDPGAGSGAGPAAGVADSADGADARNDLVQTFAQILGGTVVAGGLYFTWRGLRLNREGQITERYLQAISQLGSVIQPGVTVQVGRGGAPRSSVVAHGAADGGEPNLESRLGAIYALERIARNSAPDHWPIMELLTAYVRRNAPWNPATDAGPSREDRPAEDVQAVLTVLKRRKRYYRKGETDILDLSGTDLRGADLSQAHLEAARFVGANLANANFESAHLQGAHFEGSRLDGAHLILASLERAHFDGASLAGADLTAAILLEAELTHAAGLTLDQVRAGRLVERALLPPALADAVRASRFR